MNCTVRCDESSASYNFYKTILCYTMSPIQWFAALQQRYFRSVDQSIFPQLCVGCGYELLPTARHCFCLQCRNRVQETSFHTHPANPVTERFWGRLPIAAGTALYFFGKKCPIQRALHALKYHNQPEIGRQLGRMLGKAILESPQFKGLEGIVPVPLHPRKERDRGYNQSATIAEGIGTTLGLPVYASALSRAHNARSQTKQHRLERFFNVQEAFSLKQEKIITGKHLLLVDDVLTTGATIESCGLQLLRASDVRISVAVVAMATPSLVLPLFPMEDMTSVD
jgi:competence protein ComFC